MSWLMPFAQDLRAEDLAGSAEQGDDAHEADPLFAPVAAHRGGV